jgi:glycosyltransferase involved in cell wall biosynthesis
VSKEKINIAYVGLSGFPYGFAVIQHIRTVAKGLLSAGVPVTAICRKGLHDPAEPIKFSPSGMFEGMRYVYTSPSIYRDPNFIKRNISKIIGLINEIRLLAKLAVNSETFAVVITSLAFLDVVYYWLLSKIFRFYIVMNYVEFNSSIPGRTGLKNRINDFFFDNYSFYFVDIVLPISEFLIERVHKRVPHKPYLKLTPLSDFQRFNIPKKKVDRPYFALCASANYLDVILFSVKAFELLTNHIENVSLYLIVGGDQKAMDRLYREIAQFSCKENVKIFLNISDEELNDIYINAVGLLIPLRPSIVDRARFPYKIAEYAATGNPIITTNYGEVKNYFIDGKTAYIAEDYDPIKYSEKMEFVIQHPDLASQVGSNAKSLALAEFNLEIFGKKLRDLILDLDNLKQ